MNLESVVHGPGEQAENPLLSAQASAGDGSAPTHHPVSRGPILVAVAEARIRAEIASELRRRGLLVVEVSDGFRALQVIADAILKEDALLRPSLIIMDALLRGCTGLSIVGGLRELGWDTPALFLTPRDDEALRHEAWLRGANGVFMRPFEAYELGAFSELILETRSEMEFLDFRGPSYLEASEARERANA